ncbi:formate dehydrogenase subunit delta [Novosphingobium sp. KCTC 2891]|uniref:formate dehydrogenase subunit delta n=1 Tax=Novosphingobium sp. KCTC 2891 TaxID=2989730 RepID=UPI00222302A7|nr:formate dehydrogenase subunit delta [Novosphingobium sp. KCTC 2891]MCW1383539.1 formate dehydrogenase subunit delta [Novosphingobium sp. KCTC 2891]
MSSHTPEKLAYMANQIARNLAEQADPAAAVASHIRTFWNPAMIAALARAGATGLEPAAEQALRSLAPDAG